MISLSRRKVPTAGAASDLLVAAATVGGAADPCLALTPPELLKAHLNLDPQVTNALQKTKNPVRLLA